MMVLAEANNLTEAMRNQAGLTRTSPGGKMRLGASEAKCRKDAMTTSSMFTAVAALAAVLLLILLAGRLAKMTRFVRPRGAAARPG